MYSFYRNTKNRKVILVTTFSALIGLVLASPLVDFSPSSIAQASSTDGASLTSTTRSNLENNLISFENSASSGGSTVDTRDVSTHALSAVLLGRSSDEVQSLMERVFAAQNQDESSSDFGNINWQVNSTSISDINSNEFNALAYGPLLMLGRPQFSSSFTTELNASASALTSALTRRTFETPAYTNIYLMNSISLMVIGRALGDETALALGRQRLSDWITFTQKNGITEFDSPTYSGVQLDVLLTGYRFTEGTEHEMTRKALDLLWTDMAANYFGGGLSGAFSRSYDFIGSKGRIDSHYVSVGLIDTSKTSKIDKNPDVFTAMNEMPDGYFPSEEILSLATQPNRSIRSRVGTEAFQTRINEVTPEFAISSVGGGSYGPQDRLFNVTFPQRGMPNMLVMPDTFDAPYGQEQKSDSSGHSKPTHPAANIAAVQQDGTALLTYAFQPSDRNGTPSQFATNILFPTDADEVLLNGQAIDPRGTTKQSIGSTLAVRVGNACVALRVLQADGASELAVTTDSQGQTLGVSRLVIRQDPKQPLARVALLARAETCSSQRSITQVAADVSAAPAATHLDSSGWQVTAELGNHQLDVQRDLTAGNIQSRQIDGVEQTLSSALSIDGDDRGAALTQ
jgi:hypothetical protein